MFGRASRGLDSSWVFEVFRSLPVRFSPETYPKGTIELHTNEDPNRREVPTHSPILPHPRTSTWELKLWIAQECFQVFHKENSEWVYTAHWCYFKAGVANKLMH